MKTNVTMIRKLDNYSLEQRTVDGYFEANGLLQQWNKKNVKREMNRFLTSPKTLEFANEIEERSPIAEVRNGENQAFIKQSSRNTKNGRTPDKVWMHPYLFIDFAMWLNPSFKYDVIQFVYDQLLKTRNEAGDFYKGLMSAIRIFEPSSRDYILIAKALNYIVFREHKRNIRQSATREQLEHLSDLQKQLAFAIDMGYIKSITELVNELRRIFQRG